MAGESETIKIDFTDQKICERSIFRVKLSTYTLNLVSTCTRFRYLKNKYNRLFFQFDSFYTIKIILGIKQYEVEARNID